MSWRTVIITNQCKLDLKMGYMVVRGAETKRVFLDEIYMLVIENPAVSLTCCLLEELVNHKIKVIFCNSTHSPLAELVPYYGCYDDSRKIRNQIKWDRQIKELIWKEIVSEKIKKQAEFLHDIGKIVEEKQLLGYLNEIEGMDDTNREGFAAKIYFNALFGKDFIRSEENAINASLNYGYSMILAAFNREIVAHGYLTQLGLFHDNMFNHFNLSSDLMEPYRILVDRFVYRLQPAVFDSNTKHALWELLDQKVNIMNQNQYINNAIRIYVRSVFEAIDDRDVSKIEYFARVSPSIRSRSPGNPLEETT